MILESYRRRTKDPGQWSLLVQLVGNNALTPWARGRRLDVERRSLWAACRRNDTELSDPPMLTELRHDPGVILRAPAGLALGLDEAMRWSLLSVSDSPRTGELPVPKGFTRSTRKHQLAAARAALGAVNTVEAFAKAAVLDPEAMQVAPNPWRASEVSARGVLLLGLTTLGLQAKTIAPLTGIDDQRAVRSALSYARQEMGLLGGAPPDIRAALTLGVFAIGQPYEPIDAVRATLA